MRKGEVNPLGASDNDKVYCIDKSTGKKTTQRCLTINYAMIDGKYYVWSASTINGSCPNGDIVFN